MKWNELFFLITFVLLIACSEETPERSNPSDSRSTAVTVINDEIKGEPVVIYINGATETMVAFSRNTSQGVVEFSTPEISSNSIFQDNTGNQWNIFGEGLSAGNLNEKLIPMNYLYGYWFVFPSFFDSVLVHQQQLLTFPEKSLDNDDWLIPTSSIVSTGAHDLLPSIDNPQYLNADEIIRSNPEELQYPPLNTLATVVKDDDDVYIYPHHILNYHEIVNDEINGTPVTISFCPLTQTSQLWLRNEIDNTSFGVSGLLYNSNLILYDRATESYWPQVMQKSVHGEKMGNKIQWQHVVELKLRDALQLEGNKYALSLSTGYDRDYNEDFYEIYKNAEGAIYHPVARRSDLLPVKEKVLGVIVNKNYVKVYQYPE